MKSIDEQIIDALEPIPFEVLEANSKRIVMTPYGLQDGNGVDVMLIRDALLLKPEERARRAYEFTAGMVRDREHARRK